MKKWTCEVCGYTHHGDEPPERCPQCGASRLKIYEDKRKDGCGFNIFIVLIISAAIGILLFS